MEINWDNVKKNLKAMGVSHMEYPPDEALSGFMLQCGYTAYPMLVDLEPLETVNADIGIIATHVDENTNNGVYIFCMLKDHSIALITVIASTVSKGPMVRKVSGDLTAAITGVELPQLTPFDMIEIAGQVIANTAMKSILSACNVSKDREQAFISMYLPKFLANVAMHYTGASKDGKPIVNEEIADMEPFMVYHMLQSGEVPEIFKGQGDEAC